MLGLSREAIASAINAGARGGGEAAVQRTPKARANRSKNTALDLTERARQFTLDPVIGPFSKNGASFKSERFISQKVRISKGQQVGEGENRC